MNHTGLYVYIAMIFVTFVVLEVAVSCVSLLYEEDRDTPAFKILLGILLSLIWPLTLFYFLGWVTSNMILIALEKLNFKRRN
jgi:hypothetical protein